MSECFSRYTAFFDITINAFFPIHSSLAGGINIDASMTMTGNTDSNVFRFDPTTHILYVTQPRGDPDGELVFCMKSPGYIFIGVAFKSGTSRATAGLPETIIKMEEIEKETYCVMRLKTSGDLGKANYKYMLVVQKYTEPGYAVGIIDPDIEIRPSDITTHSTRD